ncbi:isoaspartyl peptidase/L-asparaginase family protein [Roseibium litorale]|uniref:Isoaspartyl peptidase/L-asparaginase n=1 Tax=Roseibium litorale TaxID=2803841 RepID=A0ABR9CN58_9HYPH|nr:isoaspartyl peptidase/L-asparaginase [Roseibium litorale]MBD8891716.1 isoaspartyl peptidase/L-asparaginase [Roseibium litorale]
MTDGWAIALHGGAGTILKENMTPERETAYSAGLREALLRGSIILSDGGSCEDAVEAVVRALEDDPLFNAGRGAVLTADGTFELDAAIMRGKDLAAGAVTGVSDIRNPVSLARLVMERSEHVLLAGDGAARFARAQGIGAVSSGYFETGYRREQLLKAQARNEVSLDHSDHKYGTVGAVARDRNGHLAAATSTGGMTNKKPGRIGDSPLIGAGTYASDKSCAVSATGHGEMFIRMTVARDIAALMEYAGLPLEEAARRKVLDELPLIGGGGGIIAVGRSGPPVLTFNTAGMYRAAQSEGGTVETGIYAG